MKYEEIEVGKTYLSKEGERFVKYKEDTTREVITLNEVIGLLIHIEGHYEHWTEKHELPETGLLVHENGNIVYRTGDDQGYGFDPKYRISNPWSWTFITHPEYWRKATQEEEQKFIDLLKKEAQSRGLGEDAKIKECLFGTPSNSTNKNDFRPIIKTYRAWNNHGCIFQDGEWAEPLENDLSEQIEALKEKAKELNLKLNITVE